ncbi:MAG: mechanosensitive ion channel family protein [Candidatus Paceibacterota bacterium]
MLNLDNKWSEVLLNWLLDHGVKIILILILAFILKYISRAFLGNIIRKMIRSGGFSSKEAEEKRENTIIRILSGTINIIILIITMLIILKEIGFDIGPFLAAAGIVGLALGFGGQYLIRDIISGLFIILENQYRVGDTVCFDQTCGTVEDISLRMTSLRDLDGAVHHIPHGEIKRVSNQTKGFSGINIDIGVGYESDLEKVIEVVNNVGENISNDEYFGKLITKAPKFLRVNDFADSSVVIKITGETIPTKQWEVAGELRKRLKISFDKNGIEIPFPQVVVHQAKK